MDIYNLPSNSHASKEQRKLEAKEAARDSINNQVIENEKKVKKVVSGKVKTRENKGRKFADVFLAEDFESVKSHVVHDLFIPFVKKLIFEGLKDTAEMMLWGKTGRSGSSSSSNKINYRSYYDDGRDRDRYRDRDRDRDREGSYSSRFNYEDLVFETRADAEAVRRQMSDIIDQYDFVSIGDLYDMADRTAPPTAFNYGWYNVSRAEVQRVYDGYIIKLPKASPRER